MQENSPEIPCEEIFVPPRFRYLLANLICAQKIFLQIPTNLSTNYRIFKNWNNFLNDCQRQSHLSKEWNNMVKVFRKIGRKPRFSRIDALSLILILKLIDAGPSRSCVSYEIQFYFHNSVIKFYKCY